MSQMTGQSTMIFCGGVLVRPPVPELAELGLRVIERRSGVAEVRRLRLRVDDQATAALRGRRTCGDRPCACGA